MMKSPILFWVLILIAGAASVIMFAISGNAQADVTRYVREGGTGTGASWASASGTIQAMINAVKVAGGGTVCVSAGTYKPATEVGGTSSRYQTFQLKNNVAVYGGFPSSGSPGWEARDWQTNITVLSGEIGNTMTNIDNCYHVLYHPQGTNLNETAILDGFTVTRGNANGSWEQNHYYGGGIFNRNSSPHIINCAFLMNSAGDGGGAFNWDCAAAFTDCSFSDNSAVWGGGMYNYLRSPILTNCAFSANVSENDGGGMYNDYSDPAIGQCAFISNTATASGGGIYNKNSSPSLIDCDFNGNQANSGGGIHNYSSSPQVVNGTFSDNTAVNGGGMRNHDASSPVVTDCVFLENSATEEGGGLANSQSSSPIISGCSFVRNEAENGGGIHNCDGSSPVVSDCTFEENDADFGGGLQNYSGSSPIISGCTFVENTASDSGGGVFNYGGSPAFSNCAFSSNTALDGGGLAFSSFFPPLAPYEECMPAITNCTFGANAADSGGAISNRGALAAITNCIFFSNEAIDGGAVFSFGISNNPYGSMLTNCTFWCNMGINGNSIFLDSFQQLYPGTAQLTNCILWNGSPEVCNHDGSTIGITYSDVILVPGSPVYPGIGNISGVPAFINAASGDFRLLDTSPCIDSGSNAAIEATGVTSDIDGNWRIMNNRVDMGACEFSPLWSPWQYDIDHNHIISYAEMIDALMDYLIDDISYSKMIDVLMKYLS